VKKSAKMRTPRILGVLLSTTLLATNFTGLAEASVPSSPTTQPGSLPAGSTLTGQVDYSGTLPSWAQQGASLNIYQISNLNSLSIGGADSFTSISSNQVSGQTFEIALPSPGNFQFVLQSGSTAAEMFASTSEAVQFQGLAKDERRTPLNGRWVKTSIRSLKYGKTTTITATPPGPTTCVATLLSTTEAMSKIGEAHTEAKVSATFAYGTTNASEFTLGLSATGASGTFQASGTYTIEGGTTLSYPVPPSAHEYLTAGFYVGLYREDCPAVKGVITTYLTTPYGLTGKTGDLGQFSAPTNPLGYCPTPPGQYLTPGKSLGESYGSSFSVSEAFSLFGFNFGVTQHWGTNAVITYYAGVNSSTTYLCGPGGGSPSASPIVYNSARNTP
jgi:hypothetical protein